MLKRLARRLVSRSNLERSSPQPVRSAVMEYGRKRFVKSYRARVREEFDRGKAMQAAGERSGTFTAPSPLALLEEHDLIVWECLDGMTELREHLMRDVQARPASAAGRAALLGAAGQALAHIHDAFRALGDGSEHWPFREVRTGNGRLDGHVAACLRESPLQPLHWDFVCGNLFVTGHASETKHLAVVDASPNWYLFPPESLCVAAPAYVDCATLVFSLWCHPRFSPAIRAEASAYVDAFLAGYAEAGGAPLDRATVLACAAEVTRIYQRFVETGRPGSRADGPERRYRLQGAQELLDAAARSLPRPAGA